MLAEEERRIHVFQSRGLQVKVVPTSNPFKITNVIGHHIISIVAP